MRALCAIMLAVATVIAALPASAASRYGRVIYALTPKKQPTGPADVFERDLDTGKTKLLISAKAFAAEFEGSIASLAVSPNGRFLAMVSKSGETGRTHNGVWLWERAHNRFRRLVSEPAYSYECSWSGLGRYLVVRSGKGLSLYDTQVSKLRKPVHIRGDQVTSAPWSAKDDAVIVAVSSAGKASAYHLTPRTGAKRILFKWPGAIQALNRLAGGAGYALASGYSMNDARTGIYLTDVRGGHPRKLAIPKVHANEAIEEGMMSAEFALNGSGARLAVLAEYTHGMPALSWTKQLWCVEPRKPMSLLVGEWEGRDLFPSQMEAGPWTQVSYDLVGWLPGGRSVLICAKTMGVKQGGTPADHLALSAYDMARSNSQGKLLFDSGPGCLGMTWWAGPK